MVTDTYAMTSQTIGNQRVENVELGIKILNFSLMLDFIYVKECVSNVGLGRA